MEKPIESTEKEIKVTLTEQEAVLLVEALKASPMYDKYAQLIETQQDGQVIVGLISALSKELESKEEKKE